MIRLCICDDQPTEQKKIQALADAFIEQNPRFPLCITTFSSPYEVLEATAEQGGFDIYLLDILMPDISGLKLAAKIRAQDENADIIFLTTSREFGIEAFEVNAANYLLKPVSSEKFNKTLFKVVNKRSEKETKYLIIKTCDGMVRIPQNEIVVIESVNRLRVLTLAGGQSIKTRLSLTDLQELLAGSDTFLSPRRSYIINLEYVRGFHSGTIEMSDGTNIPLGKATYSEFKNKYMEFIF